MTTRAKASAKEAKPAKLTFDPLPKGFVLSKPLQRDAYDESVIYELGRQNRLVITRKRDGFKLYAVKFRNKVKLYTDGLHDITKYLPHIQKELEKILPDYKTIWAGEIVADEQNDDLDYVNSVLKSNLDRALELQKVKPLHFVAFGIVSPSLRYDAQTFNILFSARPRLGPKFIHPVATVSWPDINDKFSFDDAKKLVVKNGWEGLVLYDANFKYSYRLDGKNPERPEGCYKWKPISEDDFIVRKWFASPDDQNRLKDVLLSQIDATGREFSCGKFGGFSKDMRAKLQAAKYPLVMQFEFEARHKSGKLRTPVFMRLRDDKKPEACIVVKTFPKVEYL